MGKKVAIYRGSFNPPGRRHRLVAETLCKEFDEVIVAPWHRLPGETIKYDVPPVYRATMIDLAFQGLPKVRIEFFDLEAGEYTPASNILEKIAFHGDIWFILRPDMIRGGAMGESRVHRARDERFWKDQQFVIVRKVGEEIDASDLPLSTPALLLVGSKCIIPCFLATGSFAPQFRGGVPDPGSCEAPPEWFRGRRAAG